MLLEGRLFSADGAATVRNEMRDPSGSRLRRLPGHIESVRTPASRQTLLCFCERTLRTLIREVATWAGCPPCHQWGLAAH